MRAASFQSRFHRVELKHQICQEKRDITQNENIKINEFVKIPKQHRKHERQVNKQQNIPMKSKQRRKNMFSLCCCHALFSQNFLQPVHDDVIAFYDVRAADVFDTIARHLAGRLLASLFTALTSYIILPAQYRHVPRQSNLGDAPMFSTSPTKDLALCRETAAAP